MARYIDADRITLPQGFFEKVDNVPKFYEWLSNIPTADAVEVVRCKKCKWYQEGYDIDGKWFTRCNGSVRTYGHTKPEWFCPDGKRRE